MKCKMKVGELREALATASITMDRRAGSEYGFVYLGAKRMKSGANQRLILNSTDGIRRFLLKVVCEVEEIGDLVIAPIRLSTILDKRDRLQRNPNRPASPRTLRPSVRSYAAAARVSP